MIETMDMPLNYGGRAEIVDTQRSFAYCSDRKRQLSQLCLRSVKPQREVLNRTLATAELAPGMLATVTLVK